MYSTGRQVFTLRKLPFALDPVLAPDFSLLLAPRELVMLNKLRLAWKKMLNVVYIDVELSYLKINMDDVLKPLIHLRLLVPRSKASKCRMREYSPVFRVERAVR